MFYSESLLAKTGPLARVWLAANLEKKLTKQSILQSDIDNNVKDIIGTGQAPMALRLSGQLLLGVVRIYNRKAKYLFDDCSEALGRLKMAFRPGNVDLPAHQLLVNNPNVLTLPDTITEQDLFAPLPDPDDLFRSPGGLGGRDFLDWDQTQVLADTQMTPSSQRSRPVAGLEDDDIGADLFGNTESSIEQGRRDVAPRPDAPSLLMDDIGDDLFGNTTFGIPDDTVQDVQMQDGDDINKTNGIASSNAAAIIRAERPEARDVDSFQLDTTAYEDVDEIEVRAAQRVKRRKVLEQDLETELRLEQMKRQQEDRSAITRPPNLLPRDPVLLQLMELQRSGAFVSNILGDGRMAGWAPQLRGILSIDVVRKLGDRKRKRDSGIADVDTSSEHVVSSPRVAHENGEADFGAMEDPTFGEGDFIGDTGIDGAIADGQDYEDQPPQDMDVTVPAILEPGLSGPVSVGTKTAVAALRRHLAPNHQGLEPPTPSKRTNATASFTELCPTKSTTKADATKMFFELLVLGTKDAVKIEQESKSGLTGEIKVRGKRGLWGSWAEMEEALDTAAVPVAA